MIKTRRFADDKYVGDPLNAVRIFNDKGVDELIIVDIDATREGRDPDYRLIERLAGECRMPLCYGGGIRSASQVERLVGLGVEKVAICTAAAEKPELLREAAVRVGRQSIVAAMDVRRTGLRRTYEVVTRNGTRRMGWGPGEFAELLERNGAGEILVNSVDRDGTQEGYDLELASVVMARTSVPVTLLGGAGSLQHVEALYRRFGTVGAAAGSLFVFKGRFRAVLINYPTHQEREALFKAAEAHS